LQPIACACGRVGLWACLWSRLGRLAASFGCLGPRCVARGCCARPGAVRALRDAARGGLAGVCQHKCVQPRPQHMERGLGQDSLQRMLPLQPIACACGRVGLWACPWSRLGRLAASFGCLGRRCVARSCCARNGALRALRDAARGGLAGVCQRNSVQPSPRQMERGLGHESLLRMLPCSPSRARAGVWGRALVWACLWSRLGRLAASGAWAGVASPEAAVLAPVPCGPCAMRRAVGS
jgi:hypothetical protein